MEIESWGSYTNQTKYSLYNVKRDKDDFYIIKWSVQQEDVTFVNIYAPNIYKAKYIKKILTYLKEEVINNTIIVGNFNAPLHPWIAHSDRK